MTILAHHVADFNIVIGIVRFGFPQRMPGTDIAPPACKRNYRSGARLFHYRVIDGIIGRYCECNFVQTDKIQIPDAGGVRLCAGGVNFWCVLLQFFQIAPSAKTEYATVPQVIARGEIFFGRVPIRLFLENINRED